MTRFAFSAWMVVALGMTAAVPCAAAAADSSPEGRARQILDATGVQGGLVVHLGCGDGKLTAALHANDSYLVQGLDSDARNVAAARGHIQSVGLYGNVSAEQATGPRLPYVDNLVNLLVSENLGAVPMAEVMRVLAPQGIAYVKTAGQWTKTVKPRPKEMDEWTHYLYDAAGNPVSRDAAVAPPRHLQWVGSPTWTRHHDHISSFNAMVSAGGRVFYIVDEGLRAEIQLPSKWALIARDAFNGTILWKRYFDHWQTQLWPCKSGPAQLPRRLVAVGDKVFVALGLDAPLCALDAATGKTIRTYENTKATEEVLYSEGVLFVLANPRVNRAWSTKAGYANIGELRAEVDTWSWDTSPHTVVALEADTGKALWNTRSPVVPLSLAIDGAQAYFHDGTRVICLDRRTGRPRWESKPIARPAEIRSWFAPTLVVHQDVVLFAGAENMVRHAGGKDTMTALSAKTGQVLWTAPHPPSGYDSPEDVLIIDGLVWTAPLTNRRDSGEFTGRDLHTGEVKRTFPCDCGDHMPHHRCHRVKATDKYILASRTGIEYVDLAAQHWNRNDWVRGACLYGIMPANGLTYAPPQSCACYILAKLNGLNALAPSRQGDGEQRKDDNADRLQRGPAFSEVVSGQWSVVSTEPGAGSQELHTPESPHSPLPTSHSPLPSSPSPAPPAQSLIPNPQSLSDWPTYRHDEARDGFTPAIVPAELQRGWATALGGKLSSPVVAEGKVFVAAVEQHTVHALNQQSGAPQWHFTAGGRIDSPPTIWRGRVLFGSADGYVYCLRAADGALAWRFRAAPADERLVAFEQVESVWPVHGSVLVHEGIVHCVAGRSMFLDGGMRYLRLDAASGQRVSETVLDNRNPETGKPLDADVKWPNLPVALPDILSCDGRHVYMRSQAFDLAGRRTSVVAPSDYHDQTGADAHLFCNTGFLDDSWWHRSLWIYGKTILSGAGGWYTASFAAPAGRIMSCDQQRVYSFDRQPQYYQGSTAVEYHLFSCGKEPKILGGKPQPAAKGKPIRPTPSRPDYDWSYQVPVLGRALVLAGKTLFVAGPPRVVDEEKTLTQLDAAETQKSLAAQNDAYEGKRGALLLAVSATDGKQIAAYRLDSMPVFDGMAAAHGCLYLATTDGKVLCLSEQGSPLPRVPDVTLKTPALAGRSKAGAALTTSHPEFQQLANVRIAPADLGWRVQAATGQVGFALKKLPNPLSQQATFKFRLHMVPRDASADPPRNGFLVFGDAPEEQKLIKCGMRRNQGMIVEGPYSGGKGASRTLEAKIGETCDVTVAVDLKAQTVAMTIHGQTIETKLTSRLEAITFIGYCANSLAAEFSEIEVHGK